jgi:hypothetical protein
MAAFIFSGALAFILYQALAFAHVPATREWFRISSITIAFDEASARWAKLVLRAAMVFVLLGCVLFVHEQAGPVDAISRNRISILIGFFFGPLFAIWVNVIFAHPPGRDLTRGQIIGGIGLVLLFIVGTLGNETSGLIRQYARRVQSLKLAGAEFSFADRNRTDNDSKLAGALQLSGNGEIIGSAALGYLSQMDQIIDRDLTYLKLLDPTLFASGAPANPQMPSLDEAVRFVGKTFKQPFKCLAGWYQWTADDPTVRRHAIAYATIFRQLGSFDDRTRVGNLLVRQALAIASDIADLQVPVEVDADCTDLFRLFCELPSGNDGRPKTKSSILGTPVVRSCLAAHKQNMESPELFGEHSPLGLTADEFDRGVRAFVGGQGGGESQPYVAIAYAGLMVELGAYEAAGATLHSWLREERPKSSFPVVRAWFDVRARSMMAAYFDEWILKKGGEIPVSLRNIHMANLDVLRNSLKQYVARMPLFAGLFDDARKSREPVFRRPGTCLTTGGDIESWKKLFQSYVSMELTYVQTALRHPDYAANYAESISADIAMLARLDLSCYPKEASYPATEASITYAEILQAYARNAVSYTAARKDNETDDAAVKRLAEAERVARLGIEIAHDVRKVSADGLMPRQSFLDILTPDRSENAEEALKLVLNDIKSAQR